MSTAERRRLWTCAHAGSCPHKSSVTSHSTRAPRPHQRPHAVDQAYGLRRVAAAGADSGGTGPGHGRARELGDGDDAGRSACATTSSCGWVRGCPISCRRRYGVARRPGSRLALMSSSAGSPSGWGSSPGRPGRMCGRCWAPCAVKRLVVCFRGWDRLYRAGVAARWSGRAGRGWQRSSHAWRC
jgi:hypothetical protein